MLCCRYFKVSNVVLCRCFGLSNWALLYKFCHFLSCRLFGLFLKNWMNFFSKSSCHPACCLYYQHGYTHRVVIYDSKVCFNLQCALWSLLVWRLQGYAARVLIYDTFIVHTRKELLSRINQVYYWRSFCETYKHYNVVRSIFAQ